MISKPFDTQSDSFYFVDGKLIMHNKAAYRYLREDKSAQAKKSYEDKYSHKFATKTSKSAKEGAKAGSAAGAKEVYVEDSADAKAGAKSTGRSAKASKTEWSKESDYY